LAERLEVKTDEINKRLGDHVAIALSKGAQIGSPGFENYRFVHNALPEINFDQIDTKTSFLGREVKYPFFISCITGGTVEGARINKNLALAASEKGIAMGVGSQRPAIEKPALKKLFNVRKYAPNIPVIANVGLVQLNYGYGQKELEQAIRMVDADVLALHINPIQEVIQPEGDRNFEALLPKLRKIADKLSVPVLIKEVGFGLSEDVIRRLYDVGVRIFDTAGWGGTNWAYVEGKRRGVSELGDLFSDWGIPTADSIRSADRVKREKKDNQMVILGSGGVRSGIDIAKCICLGSELAGIATPFAQAALESQSKVEQLIDKLSLELKLAMFAVGVRDIDELKRVGIQKTPKTRSFRDGG